MAVHVIVETCENFSEPHDMESFIVPHVDKIESPSYVKEDIILNAAPEIRKFNSIHKCFSSPACDSHIMPSSTNQTSLNVSVLIFHLSVGRIYANYVQTII